MINIGITGGIGSGKSIVCEIFSLLGIPVFNADFEAKRLQNSDREIKNQVCSIFGKNIYNSDGILDRKRLADIIFSDKNALAAINGIIHPAVRKRFLDWCHDFPSAPYTLYEAAILFESGYAKDFDRNIVVLSHENLRLSRVVQRDNVTEEIVKKRILNQMSDQDKTILADYRIDNNEDCLLIPQVLNIDKLIREYGKVR